MKRLMALLWVLCVLPLVVLAEENPVVYDRTGNLTEEFVFPEGTPVLEIVFPRVYSSDCAILRFGGETMMIDASTSGTEMQWRIRTAIESMGVEKIDTAFNSHPHDDHIDGFPVVDGYCPIGQMILTFEEDFDKHIRDVVSYCRAQEIPIVHASDGDVLTMGPAGEVTLRVIQRYNTELWTVNNCSAMLHVRFGDRTILFAGDVENQIQHVYHTELPEGSLRADILKFPHHGQVRLNDGFFKAIDPALVFMNGAADVMDDGKAYLDKRKAPYLLGYKGLTRMRTDGSIWVVDYLPEVQTDRQTLNPVYTTTTDKP